MCNIDTALNEFELPIVIKNDNEYQAELESILNKYLVHMKKVKGIELEIIQDLEDDINEICECINLYYQADFSKAKEKIFNVLKKYVNDQFIVSDLNKSYAFRGMANFRVNMSIYENDKNAQMQYDNMNQPILSFFKARNSVNQMERQGMLHIPFDKRSLIATQRFSMPGIPCTYFSTSSLGCWTEMNMPDKDTFWVSSYIIEKEIKVLNLCIQQQQINGACSLINTQKEFDFAMQMIKIWPLVCATSFKVLEKDRNFKSEYIISQLIMQCIKELNIDAIAYISKKMVDNLAYPQCVNLAIPAIPIEPGSYGEIKKYIKITDPMTLGQFTKIRNINITSQSYVNKIFGEGYNGTVELMGEMINYSQSKFGAFDNYLVGQEHFSM